MCCFTEQNTCQTIEVLLPASDQRGFRGCRPQNTPRLKAYIFESKNCVLKFRYFWNADRSTPRASQRVIFHGESERYSNDHGSSSVALHK
jgi:hypothetical protein